MRWAPNHLTLRHDQSADFRRIGKDDIGAVAYHAGCDQGRSALLGTVAAAVGLEPEVSLPKHMRLAVGRRHPITVAAVADRLNAIIGIELLEIGNCRATHHAHLAAALRARAGVSGLGR